MAGGTSRASYTRRRVALILGVVTILAAGVYAATSGARSSSKTKPAVSASQRPSSVPSAGPVNVYGATSAMRPEIATDINRVYVPSGLGDMVTVIDPTTKRIVSQFSTGPSTTPQHVVPSFDLKSLWVLLNKSDQVIRIDAHTGAVGPKIPVSDPYNMYFTPDGASAIVVAERFARLDFRDPNSMKLQQSLDVPGCRGLNHADYSADMSYMLVTCEFAGAVAKVDMATRRVVGLLQMPLPPGQTPVMSRMPDGSMASSMPQDARLGPDGSKFYVADMLLGGVHVIDGVQLREIRFIPTGVGSHSVTPSHDGKLLYIANRGSKSVNGAPRGPGSVSVVNPVTDQVVANWPVPGGGSPDMGNLTPDGKELWLTGRYDSEVYVFDTSTGALSARITVPTGPHGLALWPLPGRFSLGHTGNMR